MKVEEMTDEQLLASAKQYAAREREATAAPLEAVLETIDARHPGMRQGWPQRIDEEAGPRARRRGGRERG
jgi:hypothetical protein